MSQNCWLDDESNPVVATVRNRIGDMTALSMVPSEKLQIANYGIGGHYALHRDYSEELKDSSPIFGDRISTLLIYVRWVFKDH